MYLDSLNLNGLNLIGLSNSLYKYIFSTFIQDSLTFLNNISDKS